MSRPHEESNFLLPSGEPVPATKPTKAIVAFVLAFLTALFATVQGRTDLDTMKVADWAIVVLGAVVTAAATYQVTNKPTSPDA